ncbi:hypothetical protein LguiB_011664 [Lonicera macranthoides]
MAMAMACNHHYCYRIFSHKFLSSICNSPLVVPKRLQYSLFHPSTRNSTQHNSSATAVSASSSSFTWEDVLQIAQSQDNGSSSSGLHGFFEKIDTCNRGSNMQREFIPFVMEDQVVGYVHKGFADLLRKNREVFILPENNMSNGRFGDHITLHPALKTLDDRTRALGDVVKCLGEELIPGIRNELYPVTSSFGNEVFFSLERAAAPYFGIKAYGVHMNGYVEREGQKYLWIGKRSEAKPTYPGMLDHLVAGGLPHGISCGENVVKECEEEAGIPSSISTEAIPVGVVSYMDIDGYRYKRDVLFCYDLKLPQDFTPKNQDGEVGSFKLIPVPLVANIIRRTHFFKSNCNLVIIDFLFRHGYIRPEDFGYLELLQRLRSGDCS